MAAKFFDGTILGSANEALDFISNILESSTEYSIIGKDLEGNILLWNEGARRMYGYQAEEVVGKANSAILHTPEDVASGKPREMMEAALRDGNVPPAEPMDWFSNPFPAALTTFTDGTGPTDD